MSSITTTLDIAALVSAIVWPVLIIAVLLIYRDKIPTFTEWFSSRVNKLEFAGISLELAVAKPFTPDLAAGGFDLRHSAIPIQIGGSGAPTILRQLAEEDAADYAEVNLGTGNEWLSRLKSRRRRKHLTPFASSDGRNPKGFAGR